MLVLMSEVLLVTLTPAKNAKNKVGHVGDGTYNLVGTDVVYRRNAVSYKSPH